MTIIAKGAVMSNGLWPSGSARLLRVRGPRVLARPLKSRRPSATPIAPQKPCRARGHIAV